MGFVLRTVFFLSFFLSQNLFGSAIESRPTVLLIHGLTSSKETWEPVLNGLPEEWGIVWRLDLPGYGESYKLAYKNLKDVKDALRQFLEQKKIKSPIVIAHSMGAQLSVLCHDILKPSRLIIEDMDMQPGKKPSENSLDIFEKGFATKTELLNSLKKADFYPATVEMIDRQFVVKENNRFIATINPLVDFYYRKNVRSNPAVKDAWKALPEGLPVLLLQASKDSSVTEAGIEFMKKYHSKLEIKKIPGSTHSIHRSQTQKFLEALK